MSFNDFSTFSIIKSASSWSFNLEQYFETKACIVSIKLFVKLHPSQSKSCWWPEQDSPNTFCKCPDLSVEHEWVAQCDDTRDVIPEWRKIRGEIPSCRPEGTYYLYISYLCFDYNGLWGTFSQYQYSVQVWYNLPCQILLPSLI